MNESMLIKSLLAFAVILSFSQGIACSDQPEQSIWVELDCSQYCSRANECNEDVDKGDCEERCLSALANCQADEREAAQNQIDECSDAECNDLIACTVDAGTRCYFGL